MEGPAARGLFGLAALGLDDLVFAFALGVVPVTVLELVKLARQALRR